MPVNWSYCLLGLLSVALTGAEAQERKPAQEVRVSAKPYAPASTVLRVETDLVEVGVVVRSHDGRAIPGLTRENFVLTDQGQPRELTYFAVETPGIKSESPQTAETGAGGGSPAVAVSDRQPAGTPPRFIALYFEDFGTSGGDLKRAQIAGRRFIKEGLDDSDRVAVFSTSGDMLDYTSDKAQLTAAIDKLRAHPKFSEAGLGGCPRISPYQAYQIAVLSDPAALDAARAEAGQCESKVDNDYTGPQPKGAVDTAILGQAQLTWGQVRIASQTTLDAIARAMRTLQNLPGRRLFLLISSGLNSGTLEIEMDRLINQALHAGIVVSALDAKGLYTEVPGRGANDEINTVGALPVTTFRFETSAAGVSGFVSNQVMSDLAQATGGLFFHNNNDLPNGFRQVGSIPEVSYVLGFHPGEGSVGGKYHKLTVSLTGTKPYVVQARPGYFGFSKPSGGTKPIEPNTRERLDQEVMGASTLTDFGATVAFQIDGAQQPGIVTIKTQIHIPIDQLQFPIRDKRRVQQIRIVVALLDAAGNIAAAKEGTMDFAMTNDTYARLYASGINAGLNLDVPPSKYRLRTVVQDAVEGKMASSTMSIEAK
jgi:VWFA-related protein